LRSTSPCAHRATNKLGYVSLPHHLTLANFTQAWTQSQMWHFFLNSVYITVPAVVVTLLLASSFAYVVSRLSFRFNIPLLILFTAGNLLPQQVIITPLYRIYLAIHLPTALTGSGLLYNSILGLIVINTSFQLGFCVFVLSNYMKTIPTDMDEAAIVDGASLWTRYWRLTLPLCRPALAALATLLTTWIYNDFRPHRRDSHPSRVRSPAAPVHRRSVTRLVEGMTRRAEVR